ncbi:MAG: glycosyltransferase family 2 protein [Myxococcales bacterium]|nr:glycosyltransferase family 2 protein [Myxococcales bacterium]
MHRPILLIPAFNEETSLPQVLDRVRETGIDFEIVVVDDGSSDRTGEIARNTGATVLRHPFNLGYGAALQTGYKYALETDTEFLVQLDSDGQHNPADLSRLLQPVLEDRQDLVIGSRFLGSDYRMGALRAIGRLLFSAIARLFGLRVSDPTSGYQAMNRRVLSAHSQDSFPVDYPDVNVLIAASRQGLRISEEPVDMSAETRASTMHGGFRSLYYVYKMLLSTWTASAIRRK